MGSNLKIKYIIFGFALIFSLFSYSKTFAYTYISNCANGGNVLSDVNLSNPGPFSPNSGTQFYAIGQVTTNNCVADKISLTVSHNGGTDLVLIPAQNFAPTTIIPFIPAQQIFTSMAQPGTYQVGFITGINEPNIVNNNPQFVIKVNSPDSYISNVTSGGGGYFYLISGGTPDEDFPINTNEEINGTIGGTYTGSLTVSFSSADPAGIINIFVNGVVAYSHPVGSGSGSYTFSNVTLNQNDNVIIMLGN